MVITYTLNFMDKNALSYSANFGLIEDNVRITNGLVTHTVYSLTCLLALARKSVQLGVWICLLLG